MQSAPRRIRTASREVASDSSGSRTRRLSPGTRCRRKTLRVPSGIGKDDVETGAFLGRLMALSYRAGTELIQLILLTDYRSLVLHSRFQIITGMRTVWIFGYGSLIWRPGFEFETSMVGHVKGFERVFYQGNDKHRGSPEQLGRVATLQEKEGSDVWGRAFRVTIDETARDCPIAYLDNRESREGGYAMLTTTFHPRSAHQAVVEALVYVALPSNSLYLGPKTYPEMAREIIASHGDCGSNVEYVLNVAEFMRDEVSGVDDHHLFMLELSILTELQHFTNSSSSFRAKVESERSACSVLLHSSSSSSSSGDESQGSAEGAPNKLPRAEQQAANDVFTSTICARKLRCVDI